jgi:hypothetical protein
LVWIATWKSIERIRKAITRISKFFIRSSESLFLWRFFQWSCGHNLPWILHSPATNFRAIGDQNHVLKIKFCFSQNSELTGNRSDHELKMKSRLLWWKMFGTLVGSWNGVWREVSGLGIKIWVLLWNQWEILDGFLKWKDQSMFIWKNPIFISHSTKFAKSYIF